MARELQIEHQSADGRIFRVCFKRVEDRYQHWIETDAAVGPIVLMRSVEGTMDQSWPPSPPISELQPSSLADGGSALLGTGSAGRSYWSLSVHTDKAALVFDHACATSGSRAIGEVGQLEPRARVVTSAKPPSAMNCDTSPEHWHDVGCTYELHVPRQRRGNHILTLDLGVQESTVQLDTLDIEFASRMEFEQNYLCVCPAVTGTRPIRWRYRLTTTSAE